MPVQDEWPDCVHFLQSLKDKGWEGILAASAPFLGPGTGLTQDEDDMILGLLLSYHRRGLILGPLFDVRRLNDLLARAAPKKTTLLGANLIACAAQGQANERLVRTLDGMMTGGPAPDQGAHSLLNWGRSSGCNALL